MLSVNVRGCTAYVSYVLPLRTGYDSQCSCLPVNVWPGGGCEAEEGDCVAFLGLSGNTVLCGVAMLEGELFERLRRQSRVYILSGRSQI